MGHDDQLFSGIQDPGCVIIINYFLGSGILDPGSGIPDPGSGIPYPGSGIPGSGIQDPGIWDPGTRDSGSWILDSKIQAPNSQFSGTRDQNDYLTVPKTSKYPARTMIVYEIMLYTFSWKVPLNF